MRLKYLVFLIILSSFIGYLEWGTESKTFLIIAEAEIIHKIITHPSSVIHPFILIPLLGQLLLVYQLIKNKLQKIILYLAISCIALLFIFMLFIAITTLNLKILLSVLRHALRNMSKSNLFLFY